MKVVFATIIIQKGIPKETFKYYWTKCSNE